MRLQLASLLIVFAVATPARAERALTLDEALSLSRERNKDLKAARERVAQAQAGVEQAWVGLLPTVATNFKYTHNYKKVTLDTSPLGTFLASQGRTLADVGTLANAASGALTAGSTDPNVMKAAQDLPNALAALQQAASNPNAGSLFGSNTGPIVIQQEEQIDFALTATVPLIVPAAYPALQAAKKARDAARANFQVNEATVLVQTAQSFFAAAGTDELMLARRHAIEVARETLQNARARLDAGVVNKVEVQRAELALLRAQQAALEAADQQSSAYRALRIMVQLDEPFKVVPQDFVQAPPRPTAELAENALKLRPEYPALALQVQSFQKTAQSNAWLWAPTVSAFGNVRAFNYPGFAGDNYSWAVGVSLDWLIYDGGRRDAQRHLADAQARENAFRLSLLKDQLTDELYNARRSLDTKRKALDTAVQSVALSQQTLDLVRVQHDAGTATQLDLLQAQDSLVGAEVGVAQARFDLALADLQLRRSAGLFPLPPQR